MKLLHIIDLEKFRAFVHRHETGALAFDPDLLNSVTEEVDKLSSCLNGTPTGEMYAFMVLLGMYFEMEVKPN